MKNDPQKTNSPGTLRSSAEIVEQSSKAEVISVTTLADGSPIPNTWPELVKLMTQIKDAPLPSDPEELKLHQARIKEIARRAHVVQQVPKAPATTSQQQAEAIQGRLTGVSQRAARLVVLDKFLGATPASVGVPAEYDLKSDPKKRLLIEPEVVQGLWACRRALAAAEVFSIQNYDLAWPRERISEIRHTICKTDDTKSLRELISELSVLNDDAVKLDVSIITRRIIENQMAAAQKAVSDLIGVCRTLFQAWEKAALKRESEFFSAQNIPATRTALSNRFSEALKQLPAPGLDLSYFGISDVAAA